MKGFFRGASQSNRKESQGFTIVELLIVVVVIAILAAITVVAYNGITAQAKESSLKSELTTAAKKLQLAKVESGAFPTAAPADTASTRFQYTRTTDTFCLTATSPQLAGKAFHATQSGGAQAGACSGHTVSNTAPTENGGVVTTFAGSNHAYTDGTLANARFQSPAGVAIGADGTIYVAEYFNHRIRKITTEGVVSTLAGNGTQGTTDGVGTAARFNNPRHVAVGPSGDVFVADQNNHRIRKITPDGVVSTLAGSTQGHVNGTGSTARFYRPTGIVFDSSGNLYVTDTDNNCIRKITPDGTVSAYAGTGVRGSANGTLASAQFSGPSGITVDTGGSLYVIDQSSVRKITQDGTVSTLAGGSTPGYVDGQGSSAQFYWPEGIAIDTLGVIYVADGSLRIRKVTPSGQVSTLAGNSSLYDTGEGYSLWSTGFQDGTGTAARFAALAQLTINTEGVLFVADQHNNRIRRIE